MSTKINNLFSSISGLAKNTIPNIGDSDSVQLIVPQNQGFSVLTAVMRKHNIYIAGVSTGGTVLPIASGQRTTTLPLYPRLSKLPPPRRSVSLDWPSWVPSSKSLSLCPICMNRPWTAKMRASLSPNTMMPRLTLAKFKTHLLYHFLNNKL